MERKYLGIIRRINPSGLNYTISQDESDPNNKTMVSMQGKKLSINMPMQQFLMCWFDWQMKGHYIQDAFKDLSSSEREFLMTGITPEEWKELFKEG